MTQDETRQEKKIHFGFGFRKEMHKLCKKMIARKIEILAMEAVKVIMQSHFMKIL